MRLLPLLCARTGDPGSPALFCSLLPRVSRAPEVQAQGYGEPAEAPPAGHSQERGSTSGLPARKRSLPVGTCALLLASFAQDLARSPSGPAPHAPGPLTLPAWWLQLHQRRRPFLANSTPSRLGNVGRADPRVLSPGSGWCPHPVALDLAQTPNSAGSWEPSHREYLICSATARQVGGWAHGKAITRP